MMEQGIETGRKVAKQKGPKRRQHPATGGSPTLLAQRSSKEMSGGNKPILLWENPPKLARRRNAVTGVELLGNENYRQLKKRIRGKGEKRSGRGPRENRKRKGAKGTEQGENAGIKSPKKKHSN